MVHSTTLLFIVKLSSGAGASKQKLCPTRIRVNNMHPEIDRMIKMAQNRGSVTTAQRDMILNKAKELGDDPVEIEFVLSGLSIADTRTNQSANQDGHASSHQQHSSESTVPDTSNKTSLILGIVSTVMGVIGYASIILSILGIAAGIIGLILSNKEKKQFKETYGQTKKNPYQAAFVLSIIGISISGICFLLSL